MGRLSLKTVIWAAAALAAASGCVPALTPPQWSVDSKRVLFIHRTGSPAGALYIVELGEELSHPTRLPSEGDAKVSAVAWSADGTRVYYAACGAEGARLRKCRPDGSEDVEIAEFPGEELRWIAASTDGREVFALAAEANEPGGEIVAVDLATGRLGVLEGAPRGCLSAAMLDTAGKEILCATAVEAGGTRQAAVWRTPVAGGKAEEVLRVAADRKNPFAAVAATRDGKTIAACGAELAVAGPDGKNPRRTAMPKGSRPYFLTLSPDGKRAFVSLTAGEDKVTSTSLRIEGGRLFTAESGTTQLGGRSYSPDGSTYAEHAAAGLRVAEAAERWTVFCPVTRRQCLLAARRSNREGRTEEALGIVSYGVNSPHHDAPMSALLYEKSRLHLALAEERAAVNAFLGAYLPFPESSAPSPDGILALMKKLEPLDDRLVGPLRRAEEALTEGDLAEADARLQTAYKIVYKPENVGGILYRRSRIASKRGEARAALKLYSRAADCEGFPQRAFATLRAAHISVTLGKLDLAAERLMKTIDSEPGSPHAPALRSALEAARSVKSPLRRIVEEVAPEGRPRFWIERYARFTLRCSPGTLAEPEDDLGLSVEWKWGVSTESRRGTRRMLIEGLSARLGGAVASPDGSMLAFGAREAHVTRGAGWNAVYVADREGKVRLGSPGELQSGRLPEGRTVRSFSWAPEGNALIAVLDEKAPDGKQRTLRLEVAAE